MQRPGLVVLLLLSLLCVDGRADNQAAARDAYQEGVSRYALREFQPALDAFKRAYLQFQSPAFLYNIAQCHRELGNRDEAIHFYENYLALSPEAPDRAAVEVQIERLRAVAAPPVKPEVVVTPLVEKPVAPVVVPLVVVAVDAPKPTPVYRRWWPWTILGVAVAAGGAVTLGVTLTPRNAAVPPGLAFPVRFE